MATADWNDMNDGYHRKSEVYDMLWTDSHIDLDKYVVVGAPYGGPIAVVKDERKSLMGGGESNRLRIFSSAGNRLGEFEWKFKKGLVTMGWTDNEDLVCVLEDGSVHIYTLHGDESSKFQLGDKLDNYGVAECHIWGNGLVVRTGAVSKLIAVTDLSDPKPFVLADAGLSKLNKFPASMAVIPPALNQSRSPEVYLAVNPGSVMVVDSRQAQERPFPVEKMFHDKDKPVGAADVVKMVVSPSGTFIAMINDLGTMGVVTSDLSRWVMRFATDSKVPPKNMVWGGDDFIALHWDKLLLIIRVKDRSRDFCKYSYEGPLVMISECDGVRVVTDTSCQFLSMVPKSLEEIFKIGSMTPAALLYDAAEAFEEKKVKADENIRTIKDKNELNSAISRCLEAAAHDFTFKTQRSLLNAASYGKLHSADFRTDEFVDTCQCIRVLNAVREFGVGMPLSFGQYNKLTPEVVVDRLINRHHHLLALRICEYLHIRPERVLIHWACAKIKNARPDVSDAMLASQIVEKLRICPGISFSQIAGVAYNQGRRVLATTLLANEPLATDQVPLLLSMGEDEDALIKAIDSGDTDLVYTVIIHIKKRKKNPDFIRLIKDRPLARNLYIAYCKEESPKELRLFYTQIGQLAEAGHVAVLEAYESNDFSERLQGLTIAIDLYQKDKNSPFAVQTVDEQAKLLQTQREAQLESKGADVSGEFIDLSVSAMMEKYFEHDDVNSALKLQKKFRVPDKRRDHLQVRVMARAKMWTGLYALTTNKKVPLIGYTPFIEACLEQGQKGEAAKYIARLQDPHEKMEWYSNLGYWDEAAQVAFQEQDQDALMLIKARCKKPQLIAEIDRRLGQ